MSAVAEVTGRFAADRAALIGDGALSGRALCRALAERTDDLVQRLFDQALAEAPVDSRVALLAVGGYGRGELAPFSDLDLLLVHETSTERIEALAAGVWYPIWDLGLRLGHAVRTTAEQRRLIADDLDSATALLTGRYVAGDRELAAEVAGLGRAEWARQQLRWLRELQQRVRRRQSDAGEVAYILEPDIKNGHGGIRDVQSLWWAMESGLNMLHQDRRALEECYDQLVAIRVALHRATGRPGEILRLEDQDAAAVHSDHADADELMASVAAAGRRIAWIGDETWGRVDRRTGGRRELLAPGVVLVDGEIELAAGTDPGADPTVVLQCAVAAARRSVRIDRHTLDRLVDEVEPWSGNWPAGALAELVALLLEGHRAIPVLESLDQRGLLSRLLPEWEAVRSRPQRNAYHRYTVDRHLWEASANAAGLIDRVARPDLLVLGALFHDIGKGYPGDHTEVGMDLVRQISPRLGISAGDTEILVGLVEHHLLLPDVAMRRDLTDDSTVTQVADAVRSVEFLELLHALTEADSRATGPAAWNRWKEELVADLVARVRHVLGGGDPSEVTWRLFPDATTLAKMARGTVDVEVVEDRITIVNPDIPGTFSRIAGVLSLHRLDVLNAQAHSEESSPARVPIAASQFRVVMPEAGCDLDAVVADLIRAVNGELAIEARLAERARNVRPRRATQASPPASPALVFHDHASSNSTVIEVTAANRLGALYRITKALAELGLDIRHATVQTLGMQVVDTFYVRTGSGGLVTDPFHRAEIERAVLHVSR